VAQALGLGTRGSFRDALEWRPIRHVGNDGTCPIRFNADMTLRAGVDLGGTKVQTVVVDEQFSVLGQMRLPTPTKGGPQDVADTIANFNPPSHNRSSPSRQRRRHRCIVAPLPSRRYRCILGDDVQPARLR
jgi:hypothetical protein